MTIRQANRDGVHSCTLHAGSGTELKSPRARQGLQSGFRSREDRAVTTTLAIPPPVHPSAVDAQTQPAAPRSGVAVREAEGKRATRTRLLAPRARGRSRYSRSARSAGTASSAPASRRSERVSAHSPAGSSQLLLILSPQSCAVPRSRRCLPGCRRGRQTPFPACGR